MGMTTAIKTRQIIENSWYITAIELMAAAQAFDFLAPTQPSPATRAVHNLVRQHVPKLEEDRPLHNDINALMQVVKEGKVLAAAEGVAGKME